MDHIQPSRRTDDQLEDILCETSHWVVNGQAGRVLCFASSLRTAIEKATTYGASGAVVTTLCRLPFDNIVIFPRQIDRLRKAVAERELPATHARASAAA